MIYTIIAMGILILMMSIFLIIVHKESKRVHRHLIRKVEYVDSLYKEIETLSKEKVEFHDRVMDLENIKGEAFQVKLRNEITEVKVEFTKIEIVTIFAGVSILLERTKNPDDAKIYIALIEKINGFIGDMKEGDGAFGE